MLISSVLRCKGALFAWLGDPNTKLGGTNSDSLEKTITDHRFWANLSSIEQILRPIHEAQKMSESDNSTLSKVVPRWLKIEAELKQLEVVLPSLISGFTQLGGPFRARLKKQIIDLHFTVWLLDPISLLKPPGEVQHDAAVQFLLARTLEIDRKAIHKSLLEFRSQGGVFGPAHPASMHHDDPIAYWKSYQYNETHIVLAKLAVRIFEAIANSVASERAFSAMILIHTKLRNRLGEEKAYKLIYIYMNQRVLNRNNSLLLGDAIEKTQEEQVQLEELLLQFVDYQGKDVEDEEIN